MTALSILTRKKGIQGERKKNDKLSVNFFFSSLPFYIARKFSIRSIEVPYHCISFDLSDFSLHFTCYIHNECLWNFLNIFILTLTYNVAYDLCCFDKLDQRITRSCYFISETGILRGIFINAM